MADKRAKNKIKSKSKSKSKNKKSNMKLYSDDNPKTTLKGTGFKDENTAQRTIKLIKNRSITYQKSVITTMLYRAKHHPNQTDGMKDAIKVYEKWIKKNNKKTIKYPYLDLKLIIKYEKLAIEYNVSRKARGLEKPTKSDKGFLVVYKEQKGKRSKLPFIPIKITKPDGQDYDSHRESFIKQRLGQIKARKGKLYYDEGKYKGFPTKQHVVMIMNGYSPNPKKIKDKLKLLKKLEK
jgi:hypothetical protein